MNNLYQERFIMNKKLALGTFIISSLLSSDCKLCAEKVALTSRFLQIIDGSFLTGEIVGITLQVRKKLIEMIEGKRQPDGTYKGFYEINQRQLSIHQLADLESKLLAEQEKLEAKLQAAQIDNEKREASCELEFIEQNLAELHSILKAAKIDFQDAVSIFISRVRSVKEPVLMLINEYCEKAKRPDSLLLDWANLNDEEVESFNNSVTNFNTFNLFLNDLTNFMEALIRGCPKAQQQFKKLMIEKSK